MGNYNHKTKKPGRRICSWGQHSEKYFEEIPTEYLEWFAKNAYSQMVNRKQWAIDELDRRKALSE